MAVNTAKVKGRRTIRLKTLAEFRAETNRIAAAERAGTLKCKGNWTGGQSFHHLATWMNYAFDGAPPPGPPWFVKLMMPFMKNIWLKKGFPAGIRMRGLSLGTHGAEPCSADQGERELLAAIARFEKSRFPDRHPAFGAMTQDQWIQLNLRHAELHFSFLDPA